MLPYVCNIVYHLLLLLVINPLGMESEDIQDHQITASTVHKNRWEAWGARANHENYISGTEIHNSWIVDDDHALDDQQWIQVSMHFDIRPTYVQVLHSFTIGHS